MYVTRGGDLRHDLSSGRDCARISPPRPPDFLRFRDGARISVLNEGAARPRKRTTTLTVVVTMTRRRCNYAIESSVSPGQSPSPSLSISIFSLFPLLFFIRRVHFDAANDEWSHGVTAKSTKIWRRGARRMTGADGQRAGEIDLRGGTDLQQWWYQASQSGTWNVSTYRDDIRERS